MSSVERLHHAETLAHPLGGSQPTTLSELTTLRVGGPLGSYVEATSQEEMIQTIRQADDAGHPLLVIGGGSNLVVSDAGFPGTVLRDGRQNITVHSTAPGQTAYFSVSAGTTWDDLVCEAIANHWSGFEALSGIPGTVGAAPVQNIGAYGIEVGQLLESVTAWDRAAGEIVTLSTADLDLAYRDSNLKRSLSDVQIGGGRTWGPTGRWVVLEVSFRVPQDELSAPVRYAQLANALGVEIGERVSAVELRAAVLELRRSKGMVLNPNDRDTASAGSFFTNPILTAADAAKLPVEAPKFPVGESGEYVKSSAAWLIDHAGFRRGWAVREGAPASLSTKHVLALTNRGSAQAADIRELSDAVVAGVRERYGVMLVPEPLHIGF